MTSPVSSNKTLQLPSTSQASPTHKEELIQAFQKLESSIDNLIKVKTFDSTEATTYAEELYQIGESYTKQLWDQANAPLQTALKDKDVSLPLPLRLVEILSMEEIQSYDDLKHAVSKASHVFLELIVLKFVNENRHIYETTQSNMIKKLDQTLTTLPKDQVRTKFEIECCKAAIKKLEPGEGKWRKIGKDLGPSMFKAAIGVIVAGGAAVGAAIGALPVAVGMGAYAGSSLSSIFNLVCSVYAVSEERWYRGVWSLRWSTIRLKQTHFSEFEKIEPTLKDYKDNPRLGVYISRLFMEIIEHPDPEGKLKKLKDKVFHSGDPSLSKICSIGNKDFWEARFVAIQCLDKLANEDSLYAPHSIRIIARREIDEEEKTVKTLVSSVYANIQPKTSTAIKELSASKERQLIGVIEKLAATRKRLDEKSQKRIKSSEEILTLEAQIKAAEEAIPQIQKVIKDLEHPKRTRESTTQEEKPSIEDCKKALESAQADQEEYTKALTQEKQGLQELKADEASINETIEDLEILQEYYKKKTLKQT